MTVRSATDADIDGIRQVAKASWNTDYPDILSRESLDSGFDKWYSPEQLRDTISWARARVLVAETAADEIVGFVHGVLDREEEHGDILRIYVHPDHRGKGIGRELFEAIRDELVDSGIDELRAMVLEKNEPGNAFYRGFDFEWETTEQIAIGNETYSENTYVLDLSAE